MNAAYAACHLLLYVQMDLQMAEEEELWFIDIPMTEPVFLSDAILSEEPLLRCLRRVVGAACCHVSAFPELKLSASDSKAFYKVHANDR